VPQFRELADLFARLGAIIGSSLAAEEALAVLTAAAADAIECVDAVGVTTARNGSYETVAATSELAEQVDAIQYEVSAGPCVEAVLRDTVIRTADLRVETRWPRFCHRAVAETGVLSMLSARMFFEEGELVAGMNFYSHSPNAFDDLAETTALVLSTHAAFALAAAMRRERIDNLERALQTNREIGVAIGILMTRHLATEQQAVDLLRLASQHTHRKVSDLAQDVIATGDLEFPGPGYRRP
jgi:GAF domain-containing protein